MKIYLSIVALCSLGNHLIHRIAHKLVTFWGFFFLTPSPLSNTAEESYEIKCPSVRPSVCNAFFSGLALYSLIFCIKSGFNKHYKVTKPFFEKNSCFCLSVVSSKWGIFRPKINVFEIFTFEIFSLQICSFVAF